MRPLQINLQGPLFLDDFNSRCFPHGLAHEFIKTYPYNGTVVL